MAEEESDALENAVRQHQAGQLIEAEAIYRRILARSPDDPHVLHLIALVEHQRGNNEQAEPMLRRAIQPKTAEPDFHFTLGAVLERLGKPQDAISSYRRALKLDPTRTETLEALGLVLEHIGRYRDSMEIFERSVAHSPNRPTARYLFGRSLARFRRYEEALYSFNVAIRLKPDYIEAYIGLGYVWREMGRPDMALRSWQREAQHPSTNPTVLNELAIILREMGRLEEAHTAITKAMYLLPSSAEVHANMGNINLSEGRYAEAISCFERALELNPGMGKVYSNLAAAAMSAGRLDEALRYIDRALQLHYDDGFDKFTLAQIQLMRGDFEKGWEAYESRWDYGQYPSARRQFKHLQWDGQELAGMTVLVHEEYGYSDVIQMARYVPLLAARGARVVLECSGALMPLMRSISDLARIVERGERLPKFDYHCPVMSLPRAFRTLLETIPHHVPYLQADAERVGSFAEFFANEPKGLRVGLCWAGNPLVPGDRFRSTTLQMFTPLADVDGVAFYSFQKGPGEEQVRMPPPRLLLGNVGNAANDFADTAALMMYMDLVISVDTATAHLAGALGKPVWTLLAASADCRWMGQRDDSPWYPTMKLMRQERLTDWEELMQRVRAALIHFRDGPARITAQ